MEFKILLLTYKALNDQAISYLKDLIVIYPLRLQVYLWFLKVEWEAEPSVNRPLSCGTSCQSIFMKQTPSLPLRLGLKHSSLIKLIVRDGPGDPETSHS